MCMKKKCFLVPFSSLKKFFIISALYFEKKVSNMCDLSNQLVARGSFLPKFGNAKKLHLTTKFLLISIKHSGSLIMLSGITENGHLLISSKNAMDNKYTQVFFLLFQEYMKTVFPEDPNALHSLLQRLYLEKMTLCFELVTPILGAHGGIPLVSYFVLTAVTFPGTIDSPLSRQTMDILGLLRIATEYRLPIPGGILLLSTEASHQFIKKLDKDRHTYLSSSLEQELKMFATEHSESAIHFILDKLNHTSLQGRTIEGFVVMELGVNQECRESITLLQSSYEVIQEYRQTMEYWEESCLHIFSHMNEKFLSLLSDEKILGAFLEVSTLLDWRVPVLKKPTEEEKIQFLQHLSKCLPWQFILDVYGSGDVEGDGTICFRWYKVDTTSYFVQVEIPNDFIFQTIGFLFPGVKSVFRGFLLEWNCREVNGTTTLTPIPTAYSNMFYVLAVTKWKLLCYIINTFGLRNVLPKIYKGVSTDGEAIIRRFLENWSIPESMHVAVREYLLGLYDLFKSLREKDQKKDLYLKFVEPFFAYDPCAHKLRKFLGFQSDDASGDSSVLLNALNVIVLCLDPDVKQRSFEMQMGLKIGLFVYSTKECRIPPPEDKLVVIIPPSANPNPRMIENFLMKGQGRVLVQPTCGDEIVQMMETIGISLQQQQEETPRHVPLTVGVFAGSSIASGKSSIVQFMMHVLPKSDAMQISSERINAQEYKKLILKVPDSVKILLLHKNHPTKVGLDATLATLHGLVPHRDVNIVIVVPSVILDSSVYKERIRLRSAQTTRQVCSDSCDICPSIPDSTFTTGIDGWEEKMENTFLGPCRKYLSYFQGLRGSLILDPSLSIEESAMYILGKMDEIKVPLSDVFVQNRYASKGFFGACLFFGNEPSEYHVTLCDPESKDKGNELWSILDGKEGVITVDSYLHATNASGGGSIGLFTVQSVEGTNCSLEGLFPSDLWHVTDQATLPYGGRGGVEALHVMEEFRGHKPSSTTWSSIRQIIFDEAKCFPVKFMWN